MSKYKGYRKDVPEYRIKALNCTFADVVFFTAIHPSKIRDALVKNGHEAFYARYYQIPISKLERRSLIFLNPGSERPEDSDFEEFNPANLEKSLSMRTLSYFRLCKDHKLQPLSHAYSQHTLCRGVVDVSESKLLI